MRVRCARSVANARVVHTRVHTRLMASHPRSDLQLSVAAPSPFGGEQHRRHLASAQREATSACANQRAVELGEHMLDEERRTSGDARAVVADGNAAESRPSSRASSVPSGRTHLVRAETSRRSATATRRGESWLPCRRTWVRDSRSKLERELSPSAHTGGQPNE